MSSKIIDHLFGLADEFAPLLGGPLAVAALAGAHSLVALIDNTKALLPAADATVLTIRRDELDVLIAKVNAHADRTIASLGDG